MNKQEIWLYHKDYPSGKIFDLEEADANKDEMLQDGWVDTPAKLTVKYKAKVTQEKKAVVAEASPEDLVAAVKKLGYHVLNDEEMTEFIDQMKKSFQKSKSEAPILSALIGMFENDPEKLTKEELVVLGASHGLKLKMTMKEATMISHINKAIEDLKNPGE